MIIDEMAKDVATSASWGGKVNATPKRCWWNSVRLIKKISKVDGDYFYVEGFVKMVPPSRIAGFVFEHGWVEDAQGNVIDPTLHEDDMEYHAGVRYTKSQVVSKKRADPPFIWKTGGYGGFQDLGYRLACNQAYDRTGPDELPKV